MRTLLLAVSALAAALLAGCAAPPPDSPEACRLERRGSFRLTFLRGLATVPVTLDGEVATMLFDTGATGSAVTAPAAERLKLRGNGNVRITTKGLGGESRSFPAGIGRFEVGGVAMVNQQVIVLPFDLRGFGDHPPDGLLGMDFLSNFDVELDLRTGEGVLYNARNCPSARPDWGVRTNALVFPPTASSGRLAVETELDGNKLIAILDTGAQRTIVATATARRLGVTEQMQANDRQIVGRGVAAQDAPMRVHRFASLRFGGEDIPNPDLPVAELASTASDMLLGMNYLRNRKLWISASSRRVHISAPLRP